MKVVVLTLRYKGDHWSLLFASKKAAFRHLADYARTWWGDVAPSEPVPQEDKLIMDYFEKATEESFDIEERTVIE